MLIGKQIMKMEICSSDGGFSFNILSCALGCSFFFFNFAISSIYFIHNSLYRVFTNMSEMVVRVTKLERMSWKLIMLVMNSICQHAHVKFCYISMLTGLS